MRNGAPSCIPAELSRSWLLVSAARGESVEEALASTIDQVVIDLEDGVDLARRDDARRETASRLESGAGAWVRINPRGSSPWTRDIEALRGLPAVRGVMLAKTESAEDVTETFEQLGGSIPVLALIESALGIEEAARIAQAPGVFRLAFGSGDYRRDTGASANDLAMAYPRTRLVIASRIGGLPGPIDGPSVGAHYDVLTEQSRLAVSLGMTGKLCLAPGDAPAVNDAMSPSADDIAWARACLDEFESRGRRVTDGSDLPRLGRAERIALLARTYGLSEPA